MAGFITLPQAIMGVVGGVPVHPASPMTVIEKLRAAKSIIPGDIGGLLGQVLQNGPGAILQNPIGSVLGQMNGQLGGLVSQIQSIGGGNLGGLLSSITGAGGLQGVLGQLGGMSSALSGLTDAAQGGFGLIDAIGHANIAQILGSNLPANLGIDVAMGPLMMGGQLSGMVGQISGIASAVSGAGFDPTGAISQITGMTGQINGVMNASTGAFSGLQSQIMGITNTISAVSMLSTDTGGLGQIAQMIIQPQHMAEIQAAFAEQIRV